MQPDIMNTTCKERLNEAIERIANLKEDASEYVRKSVGNVLRDIRVCLKTKNCTIPFFLIKYKKQSIGDYSHGTKTL